MLNFKILSIMKARLLKLLFTMVAVLAVTSLSAQNEPYTEMDNDWADLGINDTVTVSNTVNKWIPYYVEPDATINNLTAPYDTAAAPESQNIYTSFSWTFDNSNGGASVSSRPRPLGSSNDTVPYIEYQFTSTNSGVGPDTVQVVETSDGGCPGDPVKVPVVVVEEPSFNVTGNGSDSIGYEICASPDQPIEISSIANNTVSGGNLRFQVDSVVDILNPDMSVNTADVVNSGNLYVDMAEDSMGVANSDIFRHPLLPKSNSITRYTFNFYGMSDHVSRKSDYISIVEAGGDETGGTPSDFTYYQPANGTPSSKITYIVYPTPQTGDIYYIPSDYDL